MPAYAVRFLCRDAGALPGRWRNICSRQRKQDGVIAAIGPIPFNSLPLFAQARFQRANESDDLGISSFEERAFYRTNQSYASKSLSFYFVALLVGSAPLKVSSSQGALRRRTVVC